MLALAPLVFLALSVTLSVQGVIEVFAGGRQGRKDQALSTIAASVLTSALALAFVTLNPLMAALILALGLVLFLALREALRRDAAAGLAAVCLLAYVHFSTLGLAA